MRFPFRMTALLALAIAGTLLAQSVPSTTDAPIDMARARELNQRNQRGEVLTPEEQSYLQRAIAQRQAARGGASSQLTRSQPAQSRPAQPAATQSTGLVPLSELTIPYKGQTGGLYGDGKNTPPDSQVKAAAAASAAIVPLNAAGKPDANGKIVLMSIGMSNTTQEFSRFKIIADADRQKSLAVAIVDCAQGGQDGAAWTANIQNNTNAVWDEAARRLNAAGVSPQQVQVVWIKQAEKSPAALGEFPKHAAVLQKDFESILVLAKMRYPNLRLAYLSSRIYAGYATGQLNPEPYAYEGAFAVRGVIQDQVAGKAELNADPAKGLVKAPVVLWGPYLWADGTKGRKLDTLVWKPEDLGPDGTHPSEMGREKVANLLLTFLKTDATAKPWFVAK